MKALTLLLPFILLLCLPSLAAQEATYRSFPPPAKAEVFPITTTENTPVTTIEFGQISHDFGTVTEGEIVTEIFTFTNTGTEPLIISDARGSCGCTVPARPNAPIAPGETASVTVQFNTKNKKGARNQKVTLTANTFPAQTFLYLTGMVEPDPEWAFNNDLNTIGTLSATDTGTEVKLPKDCFAIYPNPTAEVLKLKMDEDNFGKSAEVVILSLDGKLMARRQIETIVDDVEFDVSHYPAGTYHARVSVAKANPVSQCFVVIN